MNREELISHLGACIDAEQGVYETNRLIHELDNTIFELKHKDYNSDKVIPKPEIKPVEFNRKEPELVLEPVKGLKEKINYAKSEINDCDAKLRDYRKAKIRATVFLAIITAVFAFCMYYISTEPFLMFIKKVSGNMFPKQVGFIRYLFRLTTFGGLVLVLLPIATAVFVGVPTMVTGYSPLPFSGSIGRFLRKKSKFARILFGLLFFLPFIGLNVAFSLSKRADYSEVLLYFLTISPYLICIYGSIFLGTVCKNSWGKDYVQRLRAAEIDLENYEKRYSETLATNEKRRKEYESKQAKYETEKSMCLTDIQESNKAKKAQYEIKVKNAVLVDSLTVDTLNTEKTKQRKRLSEFVDKREELYSKDIVPERFRNVAALIQLKEYLEIGVADTLTGPDGAFRVYLDDLRTAKIIDSVDSLRSTIAAGVTILAHGQETLYKELILANMNLSIMSSRLSSSVEKITKSIRDCKFDIEDAIRREGYDNRMAFSNSISSAIASASALSESREDKYSSQIQELVDTQKSLLDTVEKSSYNQYLVQKKENLDNYLYSSLRDPR